MDAPIMTINAPEGRHRGTEDRRLARRMNVSFALLFSFFIGVIGCGQGTSNEAPARNKQPTSLPADAASKQIVAPVDAWAKIFLGGKHVGYRHLTIQPAAEPGTQQFELTQLLRITRGRDTLEQTLKQTSVESSSGRWLRGAAAHGAGATLQEDEFVVEKGVLKITMRSSGGVTRKAIPWNDERSGFFAAEASIREKPLAAGERREFATFFPIFNQPGRIVLTALDEEEIEIAGKKIKALKVKQEELLGETSTVTHLWIDDAGELLQAEIPALQMRLERATREEAIALHEGDGYDLLSSTLIPAAKAPEKSLHERSVQKYRVALRDRDPSQIFPSKSFQLVERLDERRAEITVGRNVSGIADSAPTTVDVFASPLINSNAPAIIELAKSVASEATDPAEIAAELEKKVHSYVETKDFSAALDSASEVLRTKRGDCTEHAVLLAALCRARGIPARCAAGLVYLPSQKAFGFHMWTLAYVHGRWVPLDATLGMGGARGGHLLLADSALAEGPDAELFLPVMSVLGALEIEAIEP